jgi:hypothetical protein
MTLIEWFENNSNLKNSEVRLLNSSIVSYCVIFTCNGLSNLHAPILKHWSFKRQIDTLQKLIEIYKD